MNFLKHILTKEQVFGIGIILAIVCCIKLVIILIPQKPLTNSTELVLETAKTSEETVKPILHDFDPNTADSLTLLQLGFKGWQIKNMLRYRSKGGRYKQVEDVRKIYGMTDELFAQIAPYVRIETQVKRDFRQERFRQDSLFRDSLNRRYQQRRDSFRRIDSLRLDSLYPRTRRLKKDTIIELNSADTTVLQFIKGIGPSLARTIVNYRQQLGGYASVEQLREIKNADKISNMDSLMKHFVVNPDSIHPLPVNHCSINKLSNHPYLTFTQAKAIYELRRRRIRLESIEALRGLDCLSEQDIIRLQPYLSFL